MARSAKHQLGFSISFVIFTAYMYVFVSCFTRKAQKAIMPVYRFFFLYLSPRLVYGNVFQWSLDHIISKSIIIIVMCIKSFSPWIIGRGHVAIKFEIDNSCVTSTRIKLNSFHRSWDYCFTNDIFIKDYKRLGKTNREWLLKRASSLRITNFLFVIMTIYTKKSHTI